MAVKGGGSNPLTDKIRKVVFEVPPKLKDWFFLASVQNIHICSEKFCFETERALQTNCVKSSLKRVRLAKTSRNTTWKSNFDYNKWFWPEIHLQNDHSFELWLKLKIPHNLFAAWTFFWQIRATVWMAIVFVDHKWLVTCSGDLWRDTLLCVSYKNTCQMVMLRRTFSWGHETFKLWQEGYQHIQSSCMEYRF